MKLVTLLGFLIFSTLVFSQEPPAKYQKIWEKINNFENESAQKDLQKIIKKKPNDPWPYWMMGIAMIPGMQDGEGAPYFQKAIDADSTFAPAHYGLASDLDETKTENHPRIERHYTKAIELSPTEHFYYVARGGFYLRQKNYDKAILDAETALKIYPEDSYFANKIILQSLHEQSKTEDLRVFLKKTPGLMDAAGPPEPEYNFLLGQIYESIGDKAMACKAFKKALEDQQFFDEMWQGEKLSPPAWLSETQEKVKDCK